MSFPYAKDTELKWELIAEERRVRAMLEDPEQFNQPGAKELILEMHLRSTRLITQMVMEDHIDTVMLYRHLFEKVQTAHEDASLLYTTFAIRALEKLGVDSPVIQQMERLRLLLAQKDYKGMVAMMTELAPEQPTTPGN